MAFLGHRVGNSLNKGFEVPFLLFARYAQLSFLGTGNIALLCLFAISVVM